MNDKNKMPENQKARANQKKSGNVIDRWQIREQSNLVQQWKSK